MDSSLFKPSPTTSVLYLTGSEPGISTQMEWYRTQIDGVYRQRDDKKLGSAELDNIVWFGAPHSKDYWLKREANPEDPLHKRTLVAAMRRFGFISVADWNHVNRRRQQLDSVFRGRGVYFIVEVPKVYFTREVESSHKQVQEQQIPSLKIGLCVHEPMAKFGSWLLTRKKRQWVTMLLKNPIAGGDINVGFNDSNTLMHTADSKDLPDAPPLTYTSNAVAFDSGLLEQYPWRILYIGVSDKMMNRWIGHARIIEAQSICREGFEVALMSFQFSESIFWESEVMPRFYQASNCIPKDMVDRKRLLAIEGSLIWHFQPILNIQGKRTPAWEHRKLSAELLMAGITDLRISIEPNERSFNFYTETIRSSNVVDLEYRLRDGLASITCRQSESTHV